MHILWHIYPMYSAAFIVWWIITQWHLPLVDIWSGCKYGLVPLCLHPIFATAYNNIIRVLNWALIAWVIMAFYLYHLPICNTLINWKLINKTEANGILPLVIPLFVIQFITTQVKVWCTLNHLPVTHIKMIWSHIVVYWPSKKTWCVPLCDNKYSTLRSPSMVQVYHDLVFHNNIYVYPKATNWINWL